MPPSVKGPVQSQQVLNLDSVRPRPAKAGAPSDQAGPAQDRIGPSLGHVVREAVTKHYGSVKAAALALDVDASLMQREFEAGKLGRLDGDADAKAAVSSALYEAYGRLDDPKARARRSVREMRALLDEFDQFLDFI